MTFDYSTAVSVLKPFAVFVIGITVYSYFIFKFYKFLAKKDIFELNLRQYNRFKHRFFKKVTGTILYILEYLFLFPVFIVFWSAVIASLLLFMSKGYMIGEVLLIAMAVVGAIRFTSYYREELSKDLAKMLPFALLGIFLVDQSFISFSDSVEQLRQIPSFWETVIFYFIFILLLELVLRVVHTIIMASTGTDPTIAHTEKEKEYVIK